MTETPILDERAVEEALKRHAKADQIVDEFYSTEFALAASLNDIPALCATVKRLRRERDEAFKARDLYVSLKRGQQERADEIEARALDLLQERDSLQSQLEQLRAENERLKQQATTIPNKHRKAQIMRILIEVYSASDPPDDEGPKQVFSTNGDFWITAHYKVGDWIDDAGHAVVNVVVWCELPHPANFTEVITRSFHEEVERQSSI